jgi:hypothetical protein
MALMGEITTVQLPAAHSEETDISSFIKQRSIEIGNILREALTDHKAIKYHVAMDVAFKRISADGETQHTTARFITTPQHMSNKLDHDFTASIGGQLQNKVDNFNHCASGWVIEAILTTTIMIVSYRPCQGS